MNVYAPAAAASGNLTVAVRATPAGALEWSQWNLGGGATPWAPLAVSGDVILTDSSPAVSFRTSVSGAIAVVTIRDRETGFLFESLLDPATGLLGWVQIPGIVTNSAPALSDGNLALGYPILVAQSNQPNGQLMINNYLSDQPPVDAPPKYWLPIGPVSPMVGSPAAAIVKQAQVKKGQAPVPYIFLVRNIGTTLQMIQGDTLTQHITVSDLNFQSAISPTLASANNRTVIVVADETGEMFTDWWDFGGGGHGWVSLGSTVKTQVTPAISLVDQGNYMFVLATDLTGVVRTFQGNVGGAQVGWG
jgi:hypothetical protein